MNLGNSFLKSWCSEEVEVVDGLLVEVHRKGSLKSRGSRLLRSAADEAPQTRTRTTHRRVTEASRRQVAVVAPLSIVRTVIDFDQVIVPLSSFTCGYLIVYRWKKELEESWINYIICDEAYVGIEEYIYESSR